MPWAEQIEAVWWGLGVGAAIIIVIWAVIVGGWSRRTGAVVGPHGESTAPEAISPVHDYPEGISEGHGPVPLIVKVIIVTFVVWAVGYVVLFVQRGFTFG
jgi:preprotein translocase subunit SecY